PSTGSPQAVSVPVTTPFGTYYLLACADDVNSVFETNETNNCIASKFTVEVTLADLVEANVGKAPKIAARGTAFTASDTVKNQGLVSAMPSTTRYYLSATQQKGSGAILLIGSRSVPVLGQG